MPNIHRRDLLHERAVWVPHDWLQSKGKVWHQEKEDFTSHGGTEGDPSSRRREEVGQVCKRCEQGEEARVASKGQGSGQGAEHQSLVFDNQASGAVAALQGEGAQSQSWSDEDEKRKRGQRGHRRKGNCLGARDRSESVRMIAKDRRSRRKRRTEGRKERKVTFWLNRNLVQLETRESGQPWMSNNKWPWILITSIKWRESKVSERPNPIITICLFV